MSSLEVYARPVEGPETLFQQTSPAVSPMGSWHRPAGMGEGAGVQRTLGCRPQSSLGHPFLPLSGLVQEYPEECVRRFSGVPDALIEILDFSNISLDRETSFA